MRFKATVTVPLKQPKSFSKQFQSQCRLCALHRTLVLVAETAQTMGVKNEAIPWKLERALPSAGEWKVEATDRGKLDRFAAGHGH